MTLLCISLLSGPSLPNYSVVLEPTFPPLSSSTPSRLMVGEESTNHFISATAKVILKLYCPLAVTLEKEEEHLYIYLITAFWLQQGWMILSYYTQLL